MRKQYHVVSLSGGKDSTAMLLMMIESGMKIDEIVFCDTGMEFPQMYEHIDKVENYIGRKITRLQAKHSFEYYMLDKKRLRGKYAGKTIGYGWARPNARWCTSTMKTDVVDRHLKWLSKKYNIVHYVGIAADEQKRVKDKRYPLVEWGITEKQALEYCYSRGFNWGGLYEMFDRVSCWCCPLQSLSDLRSLRSNFHNLWSKLIWLDDMCFNSFKYANKKEIGVRDLDERFRIEERKTKIELILRDSKNGK